MRGFLLTKRNRVLKYKKTLCNCIKNIAKKILFTVNHTFAQEEKNAFAPKKRFGGKCGARGKRGSVHLP